jgi:hypothetical protein
VPAIPTHYIIESVINIEIEMHLLIVQIFALAFYTRSIPASVALRLFGIVHHARPDFRSISTTEFLFDMGCGIG